MVYFKRRANPVMNIVLTLLEEYDAIILAFEAGLTLEEYRLWHELCERGERLEKEAVS
jgi:hypothetical protein